MDRGFNLSIDGIGEREAYPRTRSCFIRIVFLGLTQSHPEVQFGKVWADARLAKKGRTATR